MGTDLSLAMPLERRLRPTKGAPCPMLQRLRGVRPCRADSLLSGYRALTVVTPHPDDESLGAGALLYEAALRGMACRVICVSDGAGSHPRSRRWPPARLAARRAEELTAAVACLAPQAEILHLGYPDGAVPRASHAFEAAADRLHEAIGATDRTLVATAWAGDPHIDHAACWHLVRAALDRTAQRRLLAFPIWGRFRTDLSAVRLDGAAVMAVAEEARAAKRRAVACHRSQMGDLIDDDPDGFCMPQWMQASFLQDPEIFLAA